MPLPVPEPGLVVRYAYLWHSDYARGREDGDKDRPRAIVFTVTEADETTVAVLPVTHSPPRHPTDAGRFDYGPLPPNLFRTIRERFLTAARARRVRSVPRTE